MKPVNFYLLTDTHYFATALDAEGKAYEDYMKGELYFLKESNAIVKSVFADLLNDNKTDIIIIPGDLSKNGELASHKEFIDELYKLKNAGKKIFVITAGHDFNEWSNSYKEDEVIPVEGTPFEALYDLYFDFGFKDALAVEMRTNSYVAEISDGVRMLALNCDSPNKQKGVIDEGTLKWAQEQIDKAKTDGAYMFAICHYPILPPAEIFDFIKDTRVENWREIATFLADNGIELAFTGHMHIQSVNEFI
jgi:3',5'-cyclic AMP phosphodiesterase CpdA